MLGERRLDSQVEQAEFLSEMQNRIRRHAAITERVLAELGLAFHAELETRSTSLAGKTAVSAQCAVRGLTIYGELLHTDSLEICSSDLATATVHSLDEFLNLSTHKLLDMLRTSRCKTRRSLHNVCE